MSAGAVVAVVSEEELGATNSQISSFYRKFSCTLLMRMRVASAVIQYSAAILQIIFRRLLRIPVL